VIPKFPQNGEKKNKRERKKYVNAANGDKTER
jgi:hypothetical protein